MNKKLLLWVFVLILLVSFVNASLTTGLWAYYKLDELGNTDAVDSHTGGLTMSEIGNVPKQDVGIINSARGKYIYDTNYFNRVPFAFLGGTDEFTVNFWMNMTATGSNNCIVSMGDYSNANECIFYVQHNGGALWWRAGDVTAGTADITGAFTPKGWQMITAIKNDTSLILYVNGTLFQTPAVWTAGACLQSNNLQIGNLENPGGCGFPQGSIDEIAYWTRALTTTEITQLYNGGNGLEYPLATLANNFTITAQANYWNNSINSFEATINGTTFTTITGLINTTFLTNETELLNMSFGSTGYFNVSLINVNLSNSLQINFTLNHTILNVSAHQFNGSKILIFNVTMNSLNTSDIFIGGTTTGEFTYDLTWNESYNVSVNAPGYALINNYAVANMTNFFRRLNFTNLYVNETLNLSFKEENTGSDVVNVSFELISDIFAANYTTNPGSTSYLTLISPADYAIRYGANGYPPRFYYFTLTGRSYNELTLYLVNGSSNITATVLDETASTVDGARIEVLKYDINTNSYVLYEQVETNFEGKATLHLFKNSEFYKFRIRYNDELKPILPGGETTTSPTYILSDSITFQIRLTTPIGNAFFEVEDIDSALTFTNSQNNFRLEYSDSNGLATQACIYVDKITGLGITSYNSSCVSGASGTVLVGVSNSTGASYKATAYIYLPDERFLDNLIKTFPEFNSTGNYGLFLVILIVVVFACTGIWNPIIAIIITPIPLVFASFIGLASIPLEITIPVQIFAILIAFLISRSS